MRFKFSGRKRKSFTCLCKDIKRIEEKDQTEERGGILLTTKKSDIEGAGQGLFVHAPGVKGVVFRKGSLIIEYNGELLTDEQLNRRYGPNVAPYALEVGGGFNIDAACRRGYAAFANHQPPKKATARFRILREGETAGLFAKKNLRDGDEVTVNYGKAYRFGGYRHSTVDG